MKFSRKYLTFEQWENAIIARLIPQPKYYVRITHYIEAHPNATLAEARGHRPKEEVTTKTAAQIKQEVIQKVLEVAKEEPEGNTYRISFGVKNVPIHSTEQKRRYYGFLIQAWDKDDELLYYYSDDLKKKLIELIGAFVGYEDQDDWWFALGPIGQEGPRLFLPNTPQLWGEWEFRAELKGQIVHTRSGYLNDL